MNSENKFNRGLEDKVRETRYKNGLNQILNPFTIVMIEGLRIWEVKCFLVSNISNNFPAQPLKFLFLPKIAL